MALLLCASEQAQRAYERVEVRGLSCSTSALPCSSSATPQTCGRTPNTHTNAHHHPQGRYQDVGALPGHPATFRVTTVYHIFVLEAGDRSHGGGGSRGGGANGAAAPDHAAEGSASGGGASSSGGGGDVNEEPPPIARLWLLRQLTEEDKDEVRGV